MFIILGERETDATYWYQNNYKEKIIYTFLDNKIKVFINRNNQVWEVENFYEMRHITMTFQVMYSELYLIWNI